MIQNMLTSVMMSASMDSKKNMKKNSRKKIAKRKKRKNINKLLLYNKIIFCIFSYTVYISYEHNVILGASLTCLYYRLCMWSNDSGWV